MQSKRINASRKRQLTNDQIVANRARKRMTYANMTPAQWEQRKNQQRIYNQTPSRKEAMKATTNLGREVRRHTLNSESIAMENPLFNPTMEWPTTSSPGPQGPTVCPSDWAIPECSATPISFPPQATEDTHDDEDECGDIRSGHTTHRQNVPSGQRHVLLAHRNTMFERRIGRNTGVSNNDGEDHADENTPLPQSTMTNIGK